MPEFLPLIITGLLPLMTLLVQEWIRGRQADKTIYLDREKIFFDDDFQKFKKLESVLSEAVYIAGNVPSNLPIGDEERSRLDELFKEIMLLGLSFDAYPELYLDLRHCKGAIQLMHYPHVREHYKQDPPWSEQTDAEIRQDSYKELMKVSSDILTKCRATVKSYSAMPVKGLSVAALDRQWKRIRSKFYSILGRSRGK